MSDGFEGARAALTRAFQRRTLRRADGTTTSPCGIRAAAGTEATGEGRETARGEYVITLPGDTAVRLDLGEIVTIDEEPGRYLEIVWAPIASNLRLTQRYEANEER
jgi:hypothetical protein